MSSFIGWLLAVQVLSLATLPLTVRVFRTLPDLGYGFSKTIGLVMIGYTAWLSSMLGFTLYTRATLLVLVALVGVGSWWQWGGEWRRAARPRWRLWLASELTFLGTLVVATFIRAHNPDIAGQEKFMDYALMNAFLSASDLPTDDPWLAGFGVPYYHFGYLLLGLPAKIAGTSGPVAYNLAVAHVFAAAFTGAVSVVYAIVATADRSPRLTVDVPALVFGWLGGTMLMVVGNLVGPLELFAARNWGSAEFWTSIGVRGLAASADGGPFPNDGAWWWRASRVIPNIEPDGITEFPFFSFLLGDLHPHYTALPLNVLVIGLALAAWWRGSDRIRVTDVLIPALALGTILTANTWDVPTYWGLFLTAAVWPRVLAAPRATRWRAGLLGATVPCSLALVMFAPYFVGYQSQPLGIGVVTQRTPPISLGILLGPMLAVALGFSAWMLRCPPATAASSAQSARRFPRLAAPPAVGCGLLALGEPTLAAVGVLAGILLTAGWGWTRRGSPPSRGESAILFCWLLLTLAALVLVGVELLYVRDLFGTRMNTVFKFHYNAWVLLAVAGASALGVMWRPMSVATVSAGHGWRWTSIALISLVLISGLVYPLAATWTKSNRFASEPTLDGTRFLRRTGPTDLEAIDWLRSKVAGVRPVVVEAVGPDYQEYGRVSTFSGLPTVIGWIGHELQWRGDRSDFARREQDVDAIYRARSREELFALARPYQARYLFFGTLERDRYGLEAEQRLGNLLAVAFARGGTTVFDLPAEGSGGQVS